MLGKGSGRRDISEGKSKQGEKNKTITLRVVREDKKEIRGPPGEVDSLDTFQKQFGPPASRTRHGC